MKRIAKICLNPDCNDVFISESKNEKYCSIKCRQHTADEKKKADFCQIFKNAFPIWAGNHEELIELLKSI